MAGALLLALTPPLAAGQVAVPRADDPPAVSPTPVASGPEGITLSLVARTPGVPVALRRAEGRDTNPLAGVVVENTGQVPLVQVSLSVTFVPKDGRPRRRLIAAPVRLEPGLPTPVPLVGTDAAARLAGLLGTVEVALAGAQAADGRTWAQLKGAFWGRRNL